jgi:hypothetical protein
VAGRRSQAGPTAGAPNREPDTTQTGDRFGVAALATRRLVASPAGSPSRGVGETYSSLSVGFKGFRV